MAAIDSASWTGIGWAYENPRDEAFVKEAIRKYIEQRRNEIEAELEKKMTPGSLVECVSDGGSKKLKVNHCYHVTGTYWQNGRFYIILHGTPSSSPKLGYLADRFKLWEEVHGV